MLAQPLPAGARLLRIGQVAEALQLSRSATYDLLDRPDGLASVRIGRSRRVAVEALDEYLARLGRRDGNGR